MNIPLTVVNNGKVEEFVTLSNDLAIYEKLRYDSIRKCSEIKKLIQQLLIEPKNTYLPYSISRDAEGRVTWNKAVLLQEFSSQLVDFAGKFQEYAMTCDQLEEKIACLTKS